LRCPQSPVAVSFRASISFANTMKQHCVALVLASVCLSASAVSTRRSSSEAFARSWMQQHAKSQPDELAELKSQNPEAYAIVKALLTKRSLGLLDPRHPSASFAKPAPVSEEAASGPEAFAKLASPANVPDHEISASQEASTVYQAVSAPAGHRDWLNWKPKTSAADDEAMVNNVLGAVADLAGKKTAGLLAKRSEAASPLADDAASLGMDSDAPAPKAKASLSEVRQTDGNYLSSFSWDEDAKSQSEEKTKVQKPQSNIPAGAGSSLMSWLGFTKKQPAPQQHVEAPASKPAGNPYMMDLQ